MKAIIKRISKLEEIIEMGLLTRDQAMQRIRIERSNILDKFEEGSDKFIQCIEALIDVQSLVNDIY
jgi:hypothetical protein